MSNINKQARQVSRFDLVSGYMQKLPDGEYVFHSDYQALLDELEAKDRRNAELNSTLERWAVERAQSASELDDAEKRIAELERGSKVIKCWSCQKSVTVSQVTAEDGFCPSCNCGIDLEDYETEELVAAGIITKVGE